MPKYKLSHKNIHLINMPDGGSIFFHTDYLQLYPLFNEDLVCFLNRYKEKGYIKTKENYKEQKFKELYNFVCSTVYKSPQPTIMPLADMRKEDYKAIILPIAATCNLGCPYCFAQTDGGFNFGSFTKEDIKKVVSFLIEKQTDKETPMVIIFFGGEPLLKFDIIKYTIELFKKEYSEYKVNYSITTNGTILNDEILKTLKENKFSVLVSLDGYENEFNLRKFRDGSDSVDKVVKNIQILKQNNIDMEIRATLVNDNPYLVSTVRFFEELEVPYNIAFAYSSMNKSHHYAEYNEKNIDLIKSQLDELLKYYIDKLERKENVNNKQLESFGNDLRFRINRRQACSAGFNYFTIIANGDIYSCAHLMNDSKHKIGNIFHGINNKSGQVALPIEQLKECKDCWAKNLCLGGCFSQKIANGGSNNSPREKYECELSKLIVDFYIKLYYYYMKVTKQRVVEQNK